MRSKRTLCKKLLKEDCVELEANEGTNQKPFVEVRTITCNYCKKPGHTINICRKRQYKNSLKESEQQNKPGTSKSENYGRPGTGGRPAGNLQAAIVKLQECSLVPQE